MNIAIYTRVSTKDRGQETENQGVQLREFATKFGPLVIEYVDHESGAKSDRDQFKRMFEDASTRRFDMLLFWSLDRFSREGVLATVQHLNRLTSYGVCYRSFTEQYLDSCGIFKDAIISIMATLAKQEKVRISERTRAGLAIARAKGKVIGRPRLQVQASEITRLKAQGLSLRAISRKLRISDGSVRKLARTA